jgi:hypothetical protein
VTSARPADSGAISAATDVHSTDAAGNLKPWGTDMAKTVADQMFAQAQAAQGTGASIDWHIQQAATYKFFSDIEWGSAVAIHFTPTSALSSLLDIRYLIGTRE